MLDFFKQSLNKKLNFFFIKNLEFRPVKILDGRNKMVTFCNLIYKIIVYSEVKFAARTSKFLECSEYSFPTFFRTFLPIGEIFKWVAIFIESNRLC